jgi:hypothetical protein
MNTLQKTIVVYIFWICIHYIGSQMYARYCTPWTLMGFIMSPFTAASPQCKGLAWVVYTGSNSINAMWVLIGTFIFNYLMFPK